MLRRIALTGVVTLAVTGCASSYMEGLVGQPLQIGMARYGPPSVVFDMPDGRRAFQWEMTSSGVTPRTTTTTANFYAPPGSFANMTATQTSFGGNVVQRTCRYTMYAVQQGETWVFSGFEKPSLNCE